MNKLFATAVILLIISACAGMNPNPGERTTDMALTHSDYQRAFDVAAPRAEAGEPWAQLRLGIFYENGWGTKVDIDKAEFWYKKTMVQKASGDWAEGKLVGAMGKAGYFNQNSDARIAQYNLAQLYYNNDKNLSDALQLINNVILESEGESIYFCCEFAGGRYFSQKKFTELKDKIEKKLTSK